MAGLPHIGPHDPAFTHKFAQTKSVKYHYVEAGDPKGEPLVLVHGFPDFWYGWRYQIKFFAELGYRVIAIDNVGYGQTDAPMELEKYGLKAQSDQLAGLLDALDIPKITLIGHDWGGAFVWRFGLYYPDRVSGIISICTPYRPPSSTYRTLEEIIEILPQFAYQRELADPESIAKYDGKKHKFLSAVLMAGDCDGQTELDYMVQEYSHTGFRGPLNYYKTGKINFDDELAHIPHRHQHIIHTPAWMILAKNDPYLLPHMADGMGKVVPGVKFATVEAGHFCMTEKVDEVNQILKTAVEDLISRRNAAAAKASL
ncbi:MAG: putative epoxide hydrolase [Linnemannia elongata]|nr:MAG: putative epoxide hydrolase [Linnemannia elongata]